jgi:hypothetical protein
MGWLSLLQNSLDDVALIGWTVAVPVILLVLGFKTKDVRTSDKLQIAVLLLLTWLITSLVISATSRDLLRWDQGLLIFIVTSIGVWLALHRMIADLAWRHRWLLHVVLALLFGILLLLLVGFYGFGTSPHH